MPVSIAFTVLLGTVLANTFVGGIFHKLPSDDAWIPWHKANELPALDRYSKEHPDLNIPDNQRNPADKRQSAAGGRGFLSSKKRRCGPSIPSDPYYYRTYS